MSWKTGAPASSESGLGGDAVRGGYVGSGATLVGFTLSNGYTYASGSPSKSGGGGAYVDDGGIISNCVFRGNNAYVDGGAFVDNGGIASRSLFDYNIATGAGGVYCYFGGGGKQLQCEK